MKWEVSTEMTSQGTLELGNLTIIEDYMEVSIDICDMSESLKAEVAKAIEIAKVQYSKEREANNKECGTNWNTTWSDKPVIMDFTYLSVVLEAGKPNTYTIRIGFHDAVDDRMEQWDCDIAIDSISIEKYQNELQEAIFKAISDKYF